MILPVNNSPGRIPTLAPETPAATGKDYSAIWQAWAKEATAGSHQLREIAFERLQVCLTKQECS